MHTKTAEGQKKTNETDWLPHNFCTNTNKGQGLRVREGDNGGRKGNRGSRPIASRDNGMFGLIYATQSGGPQKQVIDYHNLSVQINIKMDIQLLICAVVSML